MQIKHVVSTTYKSLTAWIEKWMDVSKVELTYHMLEDWMEEAFSYEP